MLLTREITENIKELDLILNLDENFDLLRRDIVIAGKKASIYFVDGFIKDEVVEKMLEFILKITPDDMTKAKTAFDFMRLFTSYVEADVKSDTSDIVTGVLSGALALVIDGYDSAVMIDVRTYPTRGIAEPEDDHVLRGPRHGFCETMVLNAALLRRHIRDPRLCIKVKTAGKRSKTDIAVCYIQNMADEKLLKKIEDIIDKITLNALPMTQQSLADQLNPHNTWNPFPKIKFTERPDTAAACVLEGKIIIMVDNSPSALILPTTIFDFTQEAKDFYFPPLVGSYLRGVRMSVFFLCLVLMPVWYLFVRNQDLVPPWLPFFILSETPEIPVFFQILTAEFIVDGLKLASLNTPSILTGSFSAVAALLLGDFAVQTGLLMPDVILYMAFVAIAGFTQPSFELGFVFKLLRMFWIIMIAIFNIWGFVIAAGLIVYAIAANKTIGGGSYIYPLWPFNWRKLKDFLVRTRADKHNN